MTFNQAEKAESAIYDGPGDRKGSIPRSRVTIYDVAEKAGVSTSTVSRILEGYVAYKEETRRKVLEAVDETGYRPNPHARKIALMKKDAGSNPAVEGHSGWENAGNRVPSISDLITGNV